MNEQLTAAQPPFFLARHAMSIAASARDYPEADGLLIDVRSQRMLVAVAVTAGIITRWLCEAPVRFDEIDERQAQLEKAGKKYICLTMHVDRLVPITPKVKH